MRIAVAVHRRLLLLPCNLDTAQPRQRVAGGRESRVVQLDGRAPMGITEAADHRPASGGTAASWAHRDVANASGKTAANDRDMAPPRAQGLISLSVYTVPCELGGPFRMGRDERDRVPLGHFGQQIQ